MNIVFKKCEINMKLIWYQYSNFACTNVHTTEIQISENYENLVFTPLATKVTYL